MRNSILLCFLLAAPLVSQANAVPGKDARLADSFSFGHQGRLGNYPDGTNGFAAGVTVCNIGTVTMDWYAPMDPRHPVYAFMLTREVDGRFEQISDWSWVKHGFASINANFCGSCRTANGSLLGPNCSDTYGSGLNADRYWLGPPAEIDPWLGAWNPVGSHFDRGQPDVGAPSNMDGSRSLSRSQASAMDPVEHRIQVLDKDLVRGDSFYYSIYVVIEGEPEANRENNQIVRQVTPSWGGSRWNWVEVGGETNGTILSRWSGARLSSVANGNDDGRFHVGVKVTGPNERGMWRYEYAVHNRDNSRGSAGFRLPICPDARVDNVTFHDIDENQLNDWSWSVQNGELAFLAPAGNALEWNTIYNFGFDCDAGPVRAAATIDQARPGPGALQLAVTTDTPGLAFSPFAGAGCGNPAPALWVTGAPPIPTLPNPSFGLMIDGCAPNAGVGLLFDTQSGAVTLPGGCVLHLANAASLPGATADGNGVAIYSIPIPADPSLEGASLFWQAVELSTGGPVLGVAELSNAVQTRLGNQTSGCR